MFTSSSPTPSSPQLRIDTAYPSPHTAQVAIVGEIDLATAQALRDSLLNLLRERPPTALNVDLSGVTFLDCTGISALIAVRDAAGQIACHMRVTDPAPIVHRLLDLTGVLHVLTASPGQTQRPAGYAHSDDDAPVMHP